MSGFRLYNRHLDAFLACAQTGSFTRAAQILYVTPTALIKRINAFEEGLGAKLFDRTTQGVKLTSAGERLRRESDALIALSDSIRRDVLRAGAADSDEIRVGASTVFPGHYVFDRFEEHRAALPDVKLRLISYGNTRLEVDRTLSRLGFFYAKNARDAVRRFVDAVANDACAARNPEGPRASAVV